MDKEVRSLFSFSFESKRGIEGTNNIIYSGNRGVNRGGGEYRSIDKVYFILIYRP